MKKNPKGKLPGGVIFTTELKRMRKNNFFKFVKEYQKKLLEIKNG